MRLSMKRLARPLAAALAFALCAGSAQAQRCAEGVPRTATLGIGLLQCVGGACLVNVPEGNGYKHDFSTEPYAWYLDEDGPADGVLREGDQILAVDGLLITTRDGGRRFANLRPNVPVRLRIRRDGEEMEVRATPEPGCNTPRLAVTSHRGRPPRRAQARPTLRENSLREGGPGVYFGLEVNCKTCGWKLENGVWRWHAAEPIGIVNVIAGSPADRAGVRAGDVLMRIDGQLLTQPDNGGFYATMRPGQVVRYEVMRRGRMVTIEVTPEVNRPM
jgi:predicted metalloprotease with PDZ domain